MKLLAVLSTLDLKYRLGCTPAWWQLLKALYENENEVVAVPYLGRDIESLWWRTKPNPLSVQSELYFHLSRTLKKKGAEGTSHIRETAVQKLTDSFTRPRLAHHLTKIMEKEGNFDAVIFFNVPLNQIRGIPSELKKRFGVKTVYYDGDMPTILPENNVKRGFMFDYYQGADLSEYDLFLVNSEGVMITLKERGANRVAALHYAADPELFQPLECEKKWDIAFFGYGSQDRTKWMTKMIADPSKNSSWKIAVGGKDFGISLGNSSLVGDVPMSAFRRFCCSSKINLNITRESHTSTYGSSTARPFELAAMGCCIVSCPYNGLEKWFDKGREIVIVADDDDIEGIYSELLGNEKRMMSMGKEIREHVLREHTYRHRSKELIDNISRI